MSNYFFTGEYYNKNMRNDFDAMLDALLSDKYLENAYEKKNMIGGKKNEEQDKEILKKLKKLEKKVREKGLSFVFNKDGKTLAKEKTTNGAYEKISRIVKKNMKKYDGVEIVSVIITFLPEEIGRKYKKDNEMGVIEIRVSVHKVVVVDYDDKLVSIVMRNNKNSILSLYYRESELSDFKLRHVKILADALITNKIKKTNMFKFHHLEDLEDTLNIDE